MPGAIAGCVDGQGNFQVLGWNRLLVAAPTAAGTALGAALRTRACMIRGLFFRPGWARLHGGQLLGENPGESEKVSRAPDREAQMGYGIGSWYLNGDSSTLF